MKYSKKRVKHICELIGKDTYTVVEICSLSGISVDTYYEWLKNKPEFSDAVAQARAQFDEMLVKEAKESLRKLVNGYEVEEKTTVFQNGKDGKPVIKEQKVVKKAVQPNPNSVEFVLTNKKPDEYKNRQTTELTGKDGKDLFAGKTDEEVLNRIKELESKFKE